MHYKSEQKEYWIAWNSEKIHEGVIEKGSEIATGMPNFITYSDKQRWLNKLEELGYVWKDKEF